MSERLEYLARTDGEDAELTVARAALADRQAALLAALVGGGPVPPGFDPAQVRAQAAGLAAKRRDTVARVVPEPALLLGPAFGPLFLRYARQCPQPGSYREDARAFVTWVLAAGEGGPGPEPRRELERLLAPARERALPGRPRRTRRPQHD
ncbi:hypothetical protein [Kitasatospora sp. NBC_00315]|uniref:hypothetical protein n=1 Tax=Kitasatospora sp. NBC_00315 TaxID=2975963 RepID=UPI0032534AB4